MQLYKSRDFSAFFQDTFSFLRQNGKHLYKNFFIINGIFIIILMVFSYFFSQFYTKIVFSGISDNNLNGIDAYMNNNSGTVIAFCIAFFLVAILSATISYAFVPIYLKLYSQNGNTFTTKAIIERYKVDLKKLLIFIGFGILIAIPIGIVVGIVSLILTITIIGILFLPVVVGIISLLYQGGLMQYLADNKSIGKAFAYAWELMSSKFWHAVGCVGIFYLMSYITQNIITMIPYFIFVVDMLTGIESGMDFQNSEAFTQKFSLMIMMIFILSFLLSTVLSIVVQVNQGIIFYSLKEDRENISTKFDIDQIGTNA